MPVDVHALLTVVILAAAIYGFVRERLPPDLTALLAILALLLTGVLDPLEAFGGFSHPATVSVAAVLVLSAGLERTGALTFLARRVLAPIGRHEFALTVALMAVIGGLSAFINNTAAVAVFIPVVMEVCRRTGARPGRILMPMAHAATLGGMCTLIGTSTNLAAHEYARNKGLPGFAMFELGRVGLPMLLAGFAYILIFGRWLLPRRALNESVFRDRPGPYLATFVVSPGSPWAGREVNGARLRRDFEIDLVEVARDGAPIPSGEARQRYREGDRLRVRGPLESLLLLGEQRGLDLQRPGGHGTEAAGAENETAKRPLTELVVLPKSPLLGRTLREARFAEMYGAVVLAIHRPGEEVAESVATTRIRAGDVLVVEGEPAAHQALSEMPGFLIVGTPSHPETRRPGQLAIAIATLIGVVTVAALGWVPIVTAATAGCAALMLTGCLRPREAYRAIDWSIIFLLAGALALGTALEKTGITEGLATSLRALPEVAGPFSVLAGFYVLAMVVSELMSNSGTVLLLAPVAVSCAAQMGLNPMALLAAITFGASAAFSLPIGYQTSLMIYGPGGYRFRDYLLMGIPLDLILAIVALTLIPAYWPLVQG